MSIISVLVASANEVGIEGLNCTDPTAIFQEEYALAFDVEILERYHPKRMGRFIAICLDGKFIKRQDMPTNSPEFIQYAKSIFVNTDDYTSFKTYNRVQTWMM